jgi:vacuolar-type H+-ATPase subunit F/Vma7
MAAFTMSGAKQKINGVAAAVVEEITEAIKAYANEKEYEAIVVAVRRIVKLSAETWRFARLEREVILAEMPPLSHDETAQEDDTCWCQYDFSEPSLGLSANEDPADNIKDRALGKMLLRLFPVIKREPTYQDSIVNGQDKQDSGFIYSMGYALYENSPSVIARREELDLANSSSLGIKSLGPKDGVAPSKYSRTLHTQHSSSPQSSRPPSAAASIRPPSDNAAVPPDVPTSHRSDSPVEASASWEQTVPETAKDSTASPNKDAVPSTTSAVSQTDAARSTAHSHKGKSSMKTSSTSAPSRNSTPPSPLPSPLFPPAETMLNFDQRDVDQALTLESRAITNDTASNRRRSMDTSTNHPHGHLSTSNNDSTLSHSPPSSRPTSGSSRTVSSSGSSRYLVDSHRAAIIGLYGNTARTRESLLQRTASGSRSREIYSTRVAGMPGSGPFESSGRL